ncbi:cupredoxin domain-containing protein [Brevibacillus sp. NRS-1366]|uniref:cupredoxin domain-containing protein n=1 Tax=Brevibacillus sp. NRS-1366 TaxID=3233899 RepID=UPI003D1EEFAE
MGAVIQVLAFVSISYVWFTWFVWKRRKQVEPMQGMVSGMTVGMMVGLIAGLLFGVLFKGDLSYSTMLSIAAGAFAGLIFGIPLSVLTMIEGTLSGMMAGMMGAMLGEMVPYEQVEPLLFLFVMLYTFCIMLLTRLVGKTAEGSGTSGKRIGFHHPLAGAMVLIGVFLWFQSFPAQSNSTAHETKQSVDLVASDFFYHPQQIVMKKGEEVKVTYHNQGKMEHVVEIMSNGNIEVIPNAAHHNHSHETKSTGELHLYAQPGESASYVIRARAEGVYSFYCMVPGHKEKGMVGSLIVK